MQDSFARLILSKGKSDNETNQYYQELQKEWVSFFECLNLVEYEDGKTIPVKSIRVLSNELYLACEQDVSLLDAIYNLLSKAVHLILPNKEVKKTGVNIP